MLIFLFKVSKFSDNVFMFDASSTEIVRICATSQISVLNCLTELMQVDLKRLNNIQNNVEENRTLYENGLNKIKELSGVDKNNRNKIGVFYEDLLPYTD